MRADPSQTEQLVEDWWMKSGGVVDVIKEYIRIPNQSPMFDPEWSTNGLLDSAAKLLLDWADSQAIQGYTSTMVQEEGRTPLLFITIEPSLPSSNNTILMYGHLDKQPPMTDTWDPQLGGPCTPFLTPDNVKLYGRGGADDGYSIFAAILSVKALQAQSVPHDRIVIVIEACEESGSFDLPHYIEKLAPQIRQPSLIVCLDSGCGVYDQFWLTTSLRGVCNGNLTVEILEEGVHSGKASGIVPSSFRIARSLLSRVEDQQTGEILLKQLSADIPKDRLEQLQTASQSIGELVHTQFPFVEGAGPVQGSNCKLLTNETWRPALSVTGADGLPHPSTAGNVLRQYTTLTLSMRLPPTVDAKEAGKVMKEVLEANPPYGAKVCFDSNKAGTGWNSPSMAPWLESAVEGGAQLVFGKSFGAMGEGGSIPFMGMLGKLFPEAQFVVTGVLGPNSNAHGPNEFLHIPQAKGVTRVISHIVQEHYVHFN